MGNTFVISLPILVALLVGPPAIDPAQPWVVIATRLDQEWATSHGSTGSTNSEQQEPQDDIARTLAEIKKNDEMYQRIRSLVIRQYQMDDEEALARLFSDDPSMYEMARSCLIGLGPSPAIRQELEKKTTSMEKGKRGRYVALLDLMNMVLSTEYKRIEHKMLDAIQTHDKDVLFLCLWSHSDEIARRALSEFRNIGDTGDVPALLYAFLVHSGPPIGGTEDKYFRIRLHQKYRDVFQIITGTDLPKIEWQDPLAGEAENDFDYAEMIEILIEWCETNWAKIQVLK